MKRKRYRMSVPRLALGAIAMATSALTMAAMVMLPLQAESGGPADAAFAASRHVHQACADGHFARDGARPTDAAR